MAESLLIGELAARTGRSVHTIRWYEAQGLIPGVLRDGGHRRVYSELHLSWLDLMDRLRRTGMSIAEMREYTALVKQGSATLKQRQALLSSHRAQVKDMIAEWQLALKLLDSKIDFYDEWVTTGKRPPVKAAERAGAALQSSPKAKSRQGAKP
ncbi:MerR family transcriptional regulator [Polaromonas sp.]|uniref:MerR family transcriptional regulator n=1 Tax=Polaromonas sp. TaxID=1869339 RepID=UPI002FC5F0C7